MAISGESLSDLMRDLKQQASPYQASLDLNSIPNFDYRSEFESALAWVRQEHDRNNAFDIEGFLKNQPYINLEKSDQLEKYSGYIEQQADQWEIGINAYHNEGRQRFTMAHELAHLLFHREYLNLSQGPYEEKEILWRSSLFNKVESEANNFAAELLMPMQVFRSLWNDQNDNNLQDTASSFNVSTQAVRYRAYKLGLTSEF